MLESTGEWTNQRLKILMGSLTTDGKKMQGARSSYNMEKWKFLLNADFKIGDGCCNVMKKNPAHKYSKGTGLMPIIATMASESMLRTQKWLQQGCNVFEGDRASSKPMSFWTEQDVLLYLKTNEIQIASVYGEIVNKAKETDQIEGQMSIGDYIGYEEFDLDRPILTTTGANRTGCMFCLYGIHLEKEPNRLQTMKKTHPKQYEYIMKPESEGGLGYREKIDWINKNGNMNIKY